MMPANWFYKLGPIVAGPFTHDEFGARVAAGEIRPKTLVRKECDGNWVPAAMVEGLLNSKVKPVPPVEIQPKPSDPPAVEAGPVAHTIPQNAPATSRSPYLVLGLTVALIAMMVTAGVLFANRGRSTGDDQIALMHAQLEQLRELIRVVDAQKAVPAAVVPAEVAEPEQDELDDATDAEPEPIPQEAVEDNTPKEIPEAILKQAEAARKARLEDQKREQARLLQRIYEQRAILTGQWEAAQQKLQRIFSRSRNRNRSSAAGSESDSRGPCRPASGLPGNSTPTHVHRRSDAPARRYGGQARPRVDAIGVYLQSDC